MIAPRCVYVLSHFSWPTNHPYFHEQDSGKKFARKKNQERLDKKEDVRRYFRMSENSTKWLGAILQRFFSTVKVVCTSRPIQDYVAETVTCMRNLSRYGRRSVVVDYIYDMAAYRILPDSIFECWPAPIGKFLISRECSTPSSPIAYFFPFSGRQASTPYGCGSLHVTI